MVTVQFWGFHMTMRWTCGLSLVVSMSCTRERSSSEVEPIMRCCDCTSNLRAPSQRRCLKRYSLYSPLFRLDVVRGHRMIDSGRRCWTRCVCVGDFLVRPLRCRLQFLRNRRGPCDQKGTKIAHHLNHLSYLMLLNLTQSPQGLPPSPLPLPKSAARPHLHMSCPEHGLFGG